MVNNSIIKLFFGGFSCKKSLIVGINQPSAAAALSAHQNVNENLKLYLLKNISLYAESATILPPTPSKMMATKFV